MNNASHFLLVLGLTTSSLSACGTETPRATLNDEAAPPASSVEPHERPASAIPTPTHAEVVKRGAHLVNTSGCHDCHTPFKMGQQGPEPDMSRMLSGHPAAMSLPPPPAPVGPWMVAVTATNTAWAGPWGTSFTANLTPDKATGLGSWTTETFIQTIRTGRHLGRGRPLLPPMPVPVYQNFSDQELAAIFAYLQTIPAIENPVPAPLPPPEAPKSPQG